MHLCNFLNDIINNLLRQAVYSCGCLLPLEYNSIDILERGGTCYFGTTWVNLWT